MDGAGLVLARLFAAAFLAFLFLQSGLDKVLDWTGNRAYINGFFDKTPLRHLTRLLLIAITIQEVSAGVLSAAGALELVVRQQSALAFAGAALASATLVQLFLGQRLAKDYAAAAAMVPYIIAAVGSVLLHSVG